MNVIREFTTTQSNYKSNLVFQIVFILLLLICTINSTIQAHETIEEAKAAKHVHIKKYYKKLQKQDGAIRLIGGRSEYEGENNKKKISSKYFNVAYKFGDSS